MANTPTPGQLIDGYRFKGGDPADQNSWELALPKAGEIVDGFRFKGGDPGVETSWEQVKQDRSFLGASLEAGGRSLLAAGARLVDSLNPFTLSEQDAATLFKDKPDQLKEITEKSASMALSRFANEQTKRAREVMQEVKPTETGAISGKPIGELEYATTDPQKAAYLSPTRVAGDVLNSMPTTLALAVSAYLTKGAAGRAATQAEQAAIARGATQAEAQAAGRAAAIEAGASTMAKTGAVGEGAVGYAQQRNQTFDQAMNLPDEAYKDSPRYRELLAQGFSPEAAKLAVASTTAEESGIIAGAVDAGTNLVGGRILGKVIGEGGKLLPRAAKGFASEAAIETVQSAGEQFGQNLAMRNINPAQSLTEGVGEAAAAGAVVGGITGGVFAGALGSPRRQMAEEEFKQASNAADAARAADALAGSLDELTGAVDAYLRQPPAAPTAPPDDTQLRLESAALAGQEAARREEDAPRQQMISRAMANIEQRGGVASPYEAELLQAAGMGQPYNTIDPSLGRPASVDEQLTAATGLAVGQEAGLGFGARESTRITSPQAFEYAADLQGRQRTEAAPTPEVTLTQAFVQEMRRTDTPAARAFVQQYDTGRITDADVQSVLDTQRALPQPAQQRLETAAAQAPAQAPEGVQVAQELRSRGVSPVLADAVQQYVNRPYTAEDLTVEGATARLERAAPVAQPAPAGIEVANVREQRGEFPGRQEAMVNRLPRPSRVGGVLASSLTDEQLRTTAANEGLPAITRRGAQIELLARQQEQRGSTSQPEIENASARLESAAAEGRLSQPSSGRIILSGAQMSTQRNLAPGASVAIKDGGVDHEVTVVDPGKLGNQGRLLTQIARIFGKRLVAFQSETLQADGFVMDRDDRSIFINTQTQISPLAVFGHELTHLLKRDNPKAYAALQAVVEREMGEGALAQFEQEYGAGANLEELTSDLVGNRFQEADFWQGVFDEIARQNPRDARSIITRLAAAINKAVSAFVRLVRQPGFQADTYVKDVNAIKAAVKQAMVDYAQAQREPAMRLETETAQAQSQVDLIGGKPFAYDRDLQGARREIGVPLVGTEERVQASRQRGYNVDNEDDNATQRNEGVSAAAAQDGRRAGEAGRREIPSYGTAREGAISVVGRHYSTAERQSLNGAYYGSGLKGAERTRLSDSTDPRLRQRVYFYVDDGAGITPEAGVGGVAHEVRLNNIYDPASRLIPTQPNINAFESAVINAGFDGYIAPFARQAAVVLLGPKHKAVPVKSIGAVASAAAPQAAAPATLKKGLLSREANAVNVDAIPGARLDMGNLEIPTSSREAANAELKRIGSPARFSPQRAVDTASLDEMFKVARSQTWAKGRDLKMAMQQRVLEASIAAGLDVTQDNPETRQYLLDVGLKDARIALGQNENAIGWYDLKTRQALAVMSLVHPEIAKNEDARFAFTWALAVTSNGLKVGKNFELAEQVYEAYKRTGRMPTNVGIGTAGNAINDSLALFNELRDAWGINNLRQFMQTNFTVSEITGVAKKLKPGGEHADVTVKGAAILGPKIGNGFFSNLYGNFDALTMDRWLIRTWGRWTGTLIKAMPEQTANARDRLRQALNAITDDPAQAQRLGDLIKLPLTTQTDIDELAGAVQEASTDPSIRERMNRTEAGLELRKAGNSLAKYLDGQKEAPGGPVERKYIRDIFGQILAQLRQTDAYKSLTMADLQAVLWYGEKRLYETAKEDVNADEDVEGYADDEAPDYANAAAQIARQKGVADRRIKSALKRVENERSTATGVTTAPGPGVGQAAGAGQQTAPRSFTGQEKQQFIGERAVLRARADRMGDAELSGAYTRGSGTDGGRVRFLKSLGVSYTNRWKIDRATATIFRANNLSTPEFLELAPTAENAQRFFDAISEAKANLKFGAAVTVYPAEQYQAMRLFLSEDGQSGVGIKPDGDIVSVFSAPGVKNGRAIMELAVSVGGRKLDAFDTILPKFYAPHGFRAVARTQWVDEFAPNDWDKAAFAKFNNGEPDVVFMVYDPAKMDAEYNLRDGRLMQGDEGYDRAVAAQTRELNKVRRAASQPTVTPSRRRNLDEIPGDELAGRKVGMPIRVEETGETATLTVDAKDALDDINEREDAMQRLLECLGK